MVLKAHEYDDLVTEKVAGICSCVLGGTRNKNMTLRDCEINLTEWTKDNTKDKCFKMFAATVLRLSRSSRETAIRQAREQLLAYEKTIKKQGEEIKKLKEKLNETKRF